MLGVGALHWRTALVLYIGALHWCPTRNKLAYKQVLTVSENGYGKRTKSSDFPLRGRGGQGVIGIQASDRNGAVVGSVQVTDADEIMLISSKGTMVRTRVDEVSVQGRNTQGVRLIRLKEGEKLVGLERVDEPAEEFVEELNSEQSENDENNAD